MEKAHRVADIIYGKCNISSTTGEIIDFDNTFSVITGYTKDNTKENLFWKEVIHPNDFEELSKRVIDRIQREGEYLGDFRIITKIGETVFVKCYAYITMDSIKALITDITAEKKAKEDLKRKAETDGLTGLLNKTSTQRLIKKCFAKSIATDTHVLMVIDADGFKKVNDKYGHLCGDNVICQISKIIKEVFRESDIMGRIGGDEFLILMKNAQLDVGERKARLICDKLREKYKNDIKITASIGVFLCDNTTNYNDAFLKADEAMYIAKAQGKNSVVVYQQKKFEY